MLNAGMKRMKFGEPRLRGRRNHAPSHKTIISNGPGEERGKWSGSEPVTNEEGARPRSEARLPVILESVLTVEYQATG